MATRGINQLKRITLLYCEHGGSSKVVRELLSDGAPALVRWAKERPFVDIQIQRRNGKHPYILAEYRSQTMTKKPADNTVNHHQVCIRSSDSQKPDVLAVMDAMANRSGRKIKKLTRPVYSDTPSVQGVWTPALNLHLTPEFPMQVVTGGVDKPDEVADGMIG